MLTIDPKDKTLVAVFSLLINLRFLTSSILSFYFQLYLVVLKFVHFILLLSSTSLLLRAIVFVVLVFIGIILDCLTVI